METVTRTIYAAHLSTCKLLNKPFTLLPNSTLNQKFNVFPSEFPTINQYPSLAYIGIGNKGASYEMSTNGYILTTPIPKLPRFASLFNFIPFIIREENNDLPAAQRQLYRMRVPMTIDGTNYFAYYLRVLDLTTTTPSVELRNVNNGVITTTNFTPDISDLNPTPPVISNPNLNNPNGDYLASSAIVNFNLDMQDIQEIMTACDIIYGDPRFAVINEIALCSGIDRVLPGQIGSTTVNYTESIATQVCAFISQYHALTSNTTGVNITFDIGSVEPLLV